MHIKNIPALDFLRFLAYQSGYKSIAARTLYTRALVSKGINYPADELLRTCNIDGPRESLMSGLRALDAIKADRKAQTRVVQNTLEYILDKMIDAGNEFALRRLADTCNAVGHTSIAWRALFAIKYRKKEEELGNHYEPEAVKFDLLEAYEQKRCLSSQCQHCSNCA